MFKKLKEFFAWRRVSSFLKAIFKGALLLLFSELKDLAIEAAKLVVEKGLPTDEEKRHEFERIMRAKAKEKGYELKDSLLNLLREIAVAYLKGEK